MSGWMQPEQEQIMRYAEAYRSLAELFGRLPCQRERLGKEDLQFLFEEIKDRVCTGCGQMGQCWMGTHTKNGRLWYAFLQDLESGGIASPEQKEHYCGNCEHPDQRKLSQGNREYPGPRGLALGNCEHPEQLALALRAGYEEARLNLLWSNRMLEQRRAAGEQILQTAELLKRTSEGFADQQERERQIRRRLGRELRFLQVEMDDVRVFAREKRETEVYLTLHTGHREALIYRGSTKGMTRLGMQLRGGVFPFLRSERPPVVSAKTIAEALSECCGERMCPAPDCRASVWEEPVLFHFVPDARYQLFCGVARITKDGELVSGDNYSLVLQDNGRVAMSLADGMGSGMEANRESEKVIELLEQFLAAGFPQETAVRMINSGMLLQNSSPGFSTIDLCMVDLYHATCDLIKAGAAPSFIRKSQEIEVIRAGSFPAGVLQHSDYESMHRSLEPGANIVMMTDGVLDAIPGENREQDMAELIIRTMTRNAQEHARRLMERVYLMQRRQARDDMTLLVGTIWEKSC
ncbi:MAG: SpoIIE family protein phosphatase [Lachnospiraceae bacterium]|nr:SpoIIE family protein phosphatase [Lachnospiraceae bacterium]